MAARGEKISKISLFVLTQLTNVKDTHTDRQTYRQTPHDGIGRAYASHRAAKSGAGTVNLSPRDRKVISLVLRTGTIRSAKIVPASHLA